MCSTDKYNMPGNALTIATQLATSGLLQQLPAALAKAEQQLQKLEPTGWCGGPCHSCARGKGSIGRIPDFSNPDSAGRQSLQGFLLRSCSHLVSFWPGGALSSTALGPSLIPMAQLALSSLQNTTQQAHKQEPVDSCPPGALQELGRAALDTCLALCNAIWTPALTVGPAASSQGQGGPTAGETPQQYSVNRMPQHAQELLLHPAMLSAAVAIACAAIYGEHVADTVTEPPSSTAAIGSSNYTGPSSSSFFSMLTSSFKALDQAGPGVDVMTHDAMKAVAPSIYLQESFGPDANLPATAWQLLSAQESSLRPGQTLLPDLQQQLVDTLGCPAKGFLWLAPLWRVRQELETFQIMSAAMQTVEAMESVKQLDSPLSGKCEVSRHSPPTASSQELLQLLLLPTVPLRWVVYLQGQKGTSHPIWMTSAALSGAVESLVYWQRLADAAAEKQQQQHQTSQRSSAKLSGRQQQAAAGSSPVAAVNELPGPVLYEYMQLFVECLWGVLQHDSSDISNARAGNSNSSSSSTGSELPAEPNSAPDMPFANTPAAAAAKLAVAVFQLLPTATKVVVGATAEPPPSAVPQTAAAAARLIRPALDLVLAATGCHCCCGCQLHWNTA